MADHGAVIVSALIRVRTRHCALRVGAMINVRVVDRWVVYATVVAVPLAKL
jgi:hypothetical protein